jgi:Uma2 family endonuclease
MSTTVNAAPAPGATSLVLKRPLYRLSVAQYEKMAEVGILKSGERVELIEGLLLEKMTQHPPHAVTLDCAQELLRPLLPGEWRLREQKPVRLADSEPEPDLVVVPRPIGRYAQEHPRPADIALVIEVADSSLAEDRDEKQRVYARARLPLYWIINIVHFQVEVYSQPRAGTAPAYRTRHIYHLGDSVPLVIAGREVARIAVRDLFPTLLVGDSE